MISKNKIEEFIRVDHAGERGAVKIYEGQLLALNTLVKDEKLKKTIEEMKIHEKEHCEFFEKEIECILDVGANIGYQSSFYSKFFGNKIKIHSFEPHPISYYFLEKNYTKSASYFNSIIQTKKFTNFNKTINQFKKLSFRKIMGFIFKPLIKSFGDYRQKKKIEKK